METARVDTIKITDDVYCIAALVKRPRPLPGYIYFNSFVIKGPEPILIDTHTAAHRHDFLKAAWALVEPRDVKWLFLTHDDRDHVGNLMQVLAACPHARMITTAIGVARMNEEYDFQMSRVNFLNPGESMVLGDRTMTAVRPPLFDSPATIGIHDSKTEVLFAADCFGAYVPDAAEEVGDIAEKDYAQGLFNLNRTFFPWFEYVDTAKFAKSLEAVRSLHPKFIANGHGPAARGRTDQLLSLMAEIPGMPRMPAPSQADLEKMLAAAARPPA